MNSPPVIVVGAGGHAVVVADALLAAGAAVLGFIDSAADLQGRCICGLSVLGDDDSLSRYACGDVVLANGIGSVGNPLLRRRVQNRLEGLGWRFVGVVHPSAVVSPFASLSADVQLLARSVVQPNARLENGCIVNSGAVIEHDVVVGAWSHVAPGAVVCGGAKLGTDCHIGAGAVVVQGVHLGERTVVGAGAAVVRDFAGCGTLAGVPARQLGI